MPLTESARKSLQSRRLGSFAFAVKSDERAFQLTATKVTCKEGYIRRNKAACRGNVGNHQWQGCASAKRRFLKENSVDDGEEIHSPLFRSGGLRWVRQNVTQITRQPVTSWSSTTGVTSACWVWRSGSVDAPARPLRGSFLGVIAT